MTDALARLEKKVSTNENDETRKKEAEIRGICVRKSSRETTRCHKITEKISFNIASEATYVYILSGQKLIKIAKNGPFWRIFENLKLAVKQCYQTGQF